MAITQQEAICVSEGVCREGTLPQTAPMLFPIS